MTEQYEIEIRQDAVTALLTFMDDAGQEYTAGALLSDLRAKDGSWLPALEGAGLRITSFTVVKPK